MISNRLTIKRFYTAFQQGDANSMASYYHPEATFEDPVFGLLNRAEVVAMWKMLIEQSKGNLQIEFSDIITSEEKGTAQWIASYTFSKTNRPVRNVIQASFEFRDGLIYTHVDTFDLWKWSKMALGWKGIFFGWSFIVKNKIRSQAKKSLIKFMQKKVTS
jgi:ketosteroid isomerase-like protein